MAEKKSTRLASRFKAAIQREEDRARHEEEARLRAEQAAAARLQALDTAREDLLSELEAFAKELGDTMVRRSKLKLRLTRGEHELILSWKAHAPELAVAFEGSDDEDRLVYDLETETWHLYLARARLVFFDEGFEELVISGLGLPRPEAPPLSPSPEPEPEPEPAPEPEVVHQAADGTTRPGHSASPPPPPRRASEDPPAPTESRRAQPALGSSVKERKDWWS